MLGIKTHHCSASACLLYFWESVHSYIHVILQKGSNLLQLSVSNKVLEKSKLSICSQAFKKSKS